MSKSIKFCLSCDNKTVRTLDDLQNNFAVEDVLHYYNNKILHRWLKARNYDNELAAVSKITSTDTVEILKELIRIFDIASDNEDIDAIVNNFKDMEERKKRYASMATLNYSISSIGEDYKNKYEELIEELIQNATEMDNSKNIIKELVSDFKWVLDYSYRDLFYKLLNKKCFLSIMCLLMNKDTRKYYINSTKQQSISLYTEIDLFKQEQSEFLAELSGILDDEDFYKILGNNVKTFDGSTFANWKHIENKSKQFMIIKMGIQGEIRSVGSSTILHKVFFTILNGIEYKSGFTSFLNQPLVYMEV